MTCEKAQCTRTKIHRTWQGFIVESYSIVWKQPSNDVSKHLATAGWSDWALERGIQRNALVLSIVRTLLLVRFPVMPRFLLPRPGCSTPFQGPGDTIFPFPHYFFCLCQPEFVSFVFSNNRKNSNKMFTIKTSV